MQGGGLKNLHCTQHVGYNYACFLCFFSHNLLFRECFLLLVFFLWLFIVLNSVSICFRLFFFLFFILFSLSQLDSESLVGHLFFFFFLFTFRTRLGIPLLVFVLFFFCSCSLLESTVSLALESEMENSELGWENTVASGEINVKLCSCRNVSCAVSLFIKFCSFLEASNDCSLLALSDLSLQVSYFRLTTCAALRIVDRNWSSRQRMFENLYPCMPRRELLNCYNIKQIKLCVIMSSKKQFHQLYFTWCFPEEFFTVWCIWNICPSRGRAEQHCGFFLLFRKTPRKVKFFPSAPGLPLEQIKTSYQPREGVFTGLGTTDPSIKRILLKSLLNMQFEYSLHS